MALSITFLQAVTLFVGSALAYLIVRASAKIWVQTLGFVIAFVGSWISGVALWALFFVSEEYSSAIVLGLSRSFLFALVGPIIGIVFVRRVESRKAIVANDEFISGFHQMPLSKLKAMSLVELDEAVSLATTDPVRRQLVFSEIHQRRVAGQNRATAVIALSSAALGALIGGYFQIAPFGQMGQAGQSAMVPIEEAHCNGLSPEEDADFNRFSKYSPNPAAGYASEGYYYYLEEKFGRYQACRDNTVL